MISEKNELFDYIFPNPSSSYDYETEGIISIPTKTSQIPCYFLPKSRETKTLNPKNKLCLYFHGNGEDIGYSYYFLYDLQKSLKLDFLSIEYPGYGTYLSPKSLIKIKQDSLDIYDYLIDEAKFNSNNIIIMGRSLGSGPASYLASKRKIASLIIISGFSSLSKFIRELFPAKFKDFQFMNEEEEFDNLKDIGESKDPVCLIHGRKDNLIKIEHAMEIEEKMKNRENFHVFYRDLMTHNSFNVKLDIIASIKSFFAKIGLEIINEL